MSKQKITFIKIEITLAAFLGLICFLLQLKISPDSYYKGYWWAATFCSGLLASILIFIFTTALIQHRIFKTIINLIEKWFSRKETILVSLVVSFLLTSSLLAFLIILSSRYARYLGDWKPIFDHVNYFIYSLLHLAALSFFLTFTVENKSIFKKDLWNFALLAKIIVWFSIIGITLLHWAVLLYQVRLFKMIPGWYWVFHKKDFHLRDFLFFFMVTASLITIFLVYKLRKMPGLSLLLCVFLFYGLQIGFGYLEGEGYESIRLKFAASTHKGYAEHASDQPELLDALIHYEEKYGKDNYLGTKPPGVLLVYAGVQKISNLYHPVNTFPERFQRLTEVMAYGFPIISLSAALLLFLLGRSLIGKENSFLPVVIYITAPNALLMPLFLDQVLYPAYFILGLLLAWKTIESRSILSACLFGVYCSLTLYFSFSMLPLLALGGAWLLADFLYKRDFRKWKKLLFLGIGMVIGVLFTLLLLRILLHYDFILRYTAAMAKHTQLKLYTPGLKNFVFNTFLNNVEFASWSGFILLILTLAHVFRSICSVIKQKATALDLFVLCSMVIYIFINLFSKTRGEVGRIWLFMLPVVALISGAEIKSLIKNERTAALFVLTVQLITTFLIFKFQDFVT